MKAQLAILTFLLSMGANAQTTITGSNLSVQGNTLSGGNGTLTLKGTRADGSATAVVTIDANGWVGAKGASFNQGVDAATLNLTGSATVNGVSNNGMGITSAGLITGVSDGNITATSQQAVNGRQLNATNTTVEANRVTAANATAAVQTNLSAYQTANDAAVATKASQASVTTLSNTVSANATAASNDATLKANNALTASKTYTDSKITITNTNVTTQVTRIDGRIDSTNATVADNKVTASNESTAKANAALASANVYTDNQVATVNANNTAQINEARVEAQRDVYNERERAMAAEQALGKEIKQVGAMAMAAAGAAGATPVGDKKTAVTTALGSYSGQSAIAVGVTHLVKENIKAFGSVSSVIGGKAGVTVGASYSF